MSYPKLSLPVVEHVGSLDPADRSDRASLEAFLVSVSLDPEIWGTIARIGGDRWIFEAPQDASWLDVHALSDEQLAEIRSWSVDAGYAQEATVWRVWHFDGESDDWRYMAFDDEQAARYEIDADDAEFSDAPTDTGEPVDSMPGLRLTEAGMIALERWHEPVNGEDGVIILWAREVLAQSDPDLVGLWWADDEHPEALSYPRGGILPERVDRFEIVNARRKPVPAGFPYIHQIDQESPSPSF